MGGDVLVPDLIRSVAMLLGGMYLAAKVPVLRRHAHALHWFRRGRLRRDDVTWPLFLRSFGASLMALYIVSDLATRTGTELSWRGPAAVVVFLFGIFGLVRTHQRDQEALTAVRLDRDMDAPEPRTFLR